MTKCCPFCDLQVEKSLVRHIKAQHGEEALREALLAEKRNGTPDAQIGDKYGISFSYLERVITREYGANISNVARKKSRITQWAPKGFQLEPTTVWSFKSRGKWATHDGCYRGNWSPYIPRNLILRYSQPYEVVLDYFSGGGTTAVEAKLLGRRCIARDINPDALALTKENLDFQPPQGLFAGEAGSLVEPELMLGDARDLSFLASDSIDLICAHPPYAGIISYSANAVQGDLSTLSVTEFVAEMQQIARESYRVLKSGRQCAILIGDARKSKRIVPIGFLTIRAFLNAGLTLRELIVKRQHNCKTTSFWYSNSIRYNFLLLAHEFLPVFEKPAQSRTQVVSRQLGLPVVESTQEFQDIQRIAREQLETTSVWIFPVHQMRAEIRRNLLGRFAPKSGAMLEIELDRIETGADNTIYPLAYIRCCSGLAVQNHFDLLDKAVNKTMEHLARDGFCVVETRDFRQDGVLVPMGLLTFEHLERSGWKLGEIVIVTSEENVPFEPSPEGCLGIAHKYLLIYRRVD